MHGWFQDVAGDFVKRHVLLLMAASKKMHNYLPLLNIVEGEHCWILDEDIFDCL